MQVIDEFLELKSKNLSIGCFAGCLATSLFGCLKLTAKNGCKLLGEGDLHLQTKANGLFQTEVRFSS